MAEAKPIYKSHRLKLGCIKHDCHICVFRLNAYFMEPCKLCLEGDSCFFEVDRIADKDKQKEVS